MIKEAKYILVLLTVIVFQLNSYAQLEASEIKTIDGKSYYIHPVEKGNTLYSISKLYKVEIGDIIEYNPEVKEGLKEGQELKIPAKQAPAETSDKVELKVGEKIHKVQKGQTLYAIAKKYKLSQEVIIARNQGVENGLQMGQEIIIPSKKEKKLPGSIIEAKELRDTLKPGNSTEPIVTFPEQNDSVSFKSELKDKYNVSLLLPFYLDINDSIHRNVKIDEEEHVYFKSLVAIEYMQGAMLALDSAAKLGISANMHVFETNNSIAQVKTLANEPELLKSDLIMGPLFRSNFEIISILAKGKGINIVSPVPQSNKVLLGNEYASKVYSSAITQMEQLATYVAKHHAEDNIVLADTKSKENESILNAFQNKLNQLLDSVNGKKVEPVQINYVSSKNIMPHIQTSRKNVFIIPNGNEVYVSNMLTKLNGIDRKHEIIVYGTEQWLDFTNTDYKYFNNLNVHVPAANYIDYDTLRTQQYIQIFRNKYGTDPGKYGILGFDVTLYYLMALQKFGTAFSEKLPEFAYEGICTQFNFFKAGIGNGYENRSVYIIQYQDYSIKLANAQ